MKIGIVGYYWLETWILANIIQLATQEFCRSFLNLQNDPCGRQYDQMTQAARSGTANIAEGVSRHYTSRETEMKLTDVARGSISELANDYLNWLMQHRQLPWSTKSADYKEVATIKLDAPNYKDDVQYQSTKHILQQKDKFEPWLSSKDSIIVARAVLVLCDRLTTMLNKQMEKQLSAFTVEGGFTEALTSERLKQRTTESIQSNAPTCPKCGKPMIQRVAKKGTNSGKPFWACSDYPNCNGTRKCESPS